MVVRCGICEARWREERGEEGMEGVELRNDGIR